MGFPSNKNPKYSICLWDDDVFDEKANTSPLLNINGGGWMPSSLTAGVGERDGHKKHHYILARHAWCPRKHHTAHSSSFIGNKQKLNSMTKEGIFQSFPTFFHHNFRPFQEQVELIKFTCCRPTTANIQLVVLRLITNQLVIIINHGIF